MRKDEVMAMIPGRELNRLVALKVMGYEPSKMYDDLVLKGARAEFPKPYSTDISAAWEVVEELKNKLQIFTYFEDEENFKNGWLVKIDGKHVEGISTAPEAICKAALFAVMDV